MKAKDIELFKNLSQNTYNGIWIDFHNDFDCIKIITNSSLLKVVFREIQVASIINIVFSDILIAKMELFNSGEVEHLTIDNLYRGRVEKNGRLIEIDKNERGYFYLEFYEGQKIEFWSSDLSIKSKNEILCK
ncbi:MAG: hypothetical protein AAF741_07255 [Bacteroidota bacterium]